MYEKMNRIGHEIQKHLTRNDIVLDIGCGVMQATTNIFDNKKHWLSPRHRFDGSLRCKTIVGVDIHDKYLDIIKYRYPTVRLDVTELSIFIDNSYDVVLCLDVLEHLVIDKALSVISSMKRIARKKVIIYTPKTFEDNMHNTDNAWNMGYNASQKHLSLLDEKILFDNGFNVIQIPNNFGVWVK